VRASILLGLALLALTACPKAKAPQEDGSVIASVNGETVSRAAFQRELDREPGNDPVEPVKRMLLNTRISEILLLQAARAANISVSAEEVDRVILRTSTDYPSEGLNEALAQDQISMAEFKQRTANSLTIEKLFQEQVYPRVAVTEAEIRNYFDQHPDEFKGAEQVHAAQIVVKGMDEARRLQQQLRSGAKFSDLARKYSLSPDAKVGGDLGFFPRGQMPRPFEEVAFKLGVNQVSDIVSTDYGYHLFKVLERRPARSLELSEVRGRIHDKLLKQKRQLAQEDYVQSLQSKATIRVNEQVLAEVNAQARPPSAPKGEP
jgi:peptidyl-prolyl cis-trans isomerase C/foldase protein PrsA